MSTETKATLRMNDGREIDMDDRAVVEEALEDFMRPIMARRNSLRPGDQVTLDHIARVIRDAPNPIETARSIFAGVQDLSRKPLTTATLKAIRTVMWDLVGNEITRVKALYAGRRFRRFASNGDILTEEQQNACLYLCERVALDLGIPTFEWDMAYRVRDGLKVIEWSAKIAGAIGYGDPEQLEMPETEDKR